MKPPPSKASGRTLTSTVGNDICAHCGAMVYRQKPTHQWRGIANSGRYCPMTDSGRHEVARVPDLQDPNEVERWLQS